MAVALRIDPALHAKLTEVAKATHSSLSQTLTAAVESYRREVMIAAMNADYGAMRANPGAWAEEERERALWDMTNLDGLRDEPVAASRPKKLPRKLPHRAPSKAKAR